MISNVEGGRGSSADKNGEETIGNGYERETARCSGNGCQLVDLFCVKLSQLLLVRWMNKVELLPHEK